MARADRIWVSLYTPELMRIYLCTPSVTNVNMNSLQKLLDKINEADPEELNKVHSFFVDRNLENDPNMEALFEVDDKLHKVPFSYLRQYLQTGKVPEDAQLKSSASASKPSRTPSVIDLKKKEDLPPQDGYYWDTNYNYEYMNPQAKKDQVLGKIKK